MATNIIPADPSFFSQEYGWGENWPTEHETVTQLRDSHQLSCYFIFSLVVILRARLVSWANIWKFFVQRVAPSVPQGQWDHLGKKFRYAFEKMFKVKDEKTHHNVFECPEELKDSDFFPANTFVVPDESAPLFPHTNEPGPSQHDSSFDTPQHSHSPENPIHIRRLMKQVEELKKELKKTQNLLGDTIAENENLRKVKGGEISGLKRKINKLESARSNDEKPKGTFIDKDTSYICILKRMNCDLEEDDDNEGAIFLGKEYHGESSGKKRVTTGKENVYVRISSPGSQRKLNTEMSNRGLVGRVRLAMNFLSLLSGTPWAQVEEGHIDGDEILPLIFGVLKHNDLMFRKLIEMGKFTLSKILTVPQMVDFKVLLNLPMATIRRMRSILIILE